MQAQARLQTQADADGAKTATTDDASTALTDGTAATADGDKTADGTHHGKRLAAEDPKSVSDALQAALTALGGAQGGVAAQAANVGNATGATKGAASLNGDKAVTGHVSTSSKTLAGNSAQGEAKGKLGDKQDPTAAATGDTASTDAKNATDALAATTTAVTQDSLSSLKSTADAANAALAASQAAAASASTATTTAAQTANPAAAAAANTLASKVGTSDWEEELGQKVVFLSNGVQQSAQLSLNPKDLGPLQVVLQVADNHAHALFVSEHPQVREAVEAALPKLREAMEQNGIGLGSASVSDGFARQTGQQGQSSGGSRSGGSGSGFASGGDSQDDVAVAKVAVRQTVGLVDTFA